MAYLREAEALAVTLDNPRRRGQVSDCLSFPFSLMGDYDQALAAAQRTLALATAGGRGGEQALATMRLGQAYRAQGDYRRAIDCLGQTGAFLDGAQRYERFGAVCLPAVVSRANLAWCHAELGPFADGSVLGEEGRRMAETVPHPGSLMVALWGRGWLALRPGDLYQALPLLERAMSICQDADLPCYVPFAASAWSAAYTLGGRVADAVPLCTPVLEPTTATEMPVFEAVLYRLFLGEAHLLTGRLEEAHALAERTLALARAPQERGNEAYALRLLGEIAARRDPSESALVVDHSQQALALAEELWMRPLQAHCHRDLGMLYTKTGQQEQARAELSIAREMDRTMEMTFWLPQVEAALTQVEGQ